MKNNAKRVLSIVLCLLMCVSMLTAIVLPAAAADTAETTDPYAKVTGTADANGVITPDANVYFVNTAFGKNSYTGTFEYTYGGEEAGFGNGKTYKLTLNTNAITSLANLKTIIVNHSTAWAAGTASRDIVVVFAPGTYGNMGYAYLSPSATDDPTADQVANVYWLGPQAGKSPVSADKSNKTAAKEIKNDRSVSNSTEAVFNNLFPLIRYSNFFVDGVAGTGVFSFYTRNNVGNYCHLSVKNSYFADLTGYNTAAFICGMSTSLNTTWDFESCYFNLEAQMDGAQSEDNPTYSNKVHFNDCIFTGGTFSKLNPANNTHQIWFLPQAASGASANFLGELATSPSYVINDCVVADWESSTLFRFLVDNNGTYETYANNGIKINVTNNQFLDVGTYNGLSAALYFNKVDSTASAASFEAKITGNLFSFSDEVFDKGTTGNDSVAINFNSPGNYNVKCLVKDNVFRAPNNGKVFHVNGFSASGAVIDMSGNLFLDNQNNVQPLMIYKGAPETLANGLNVQSDIYASAEEKGGVRELMTVKEVENGTVLYSFIQTRRNGEYSTFDYFTGALTLLLKNGVEYDADTLIKTSCDEVKFLGIYGEEACNTKVDKITQDTINGKFAKLQYQAGGSTLTVVYALNTPRNYLIVDPASAYTTDGYTFNGVTYKPDTTAENGVYAKFYTKINDVYIASLNHTENKDRLNSYTGDLLAKGDATYTDRDGQEYAYSNGLNDLILLTPGNHTMHGTAGGNLGSRVSMAVIGPQWGVSPYGVVNKEGKLANNRSVDSAKEAVINGQFTPAADQGGGFSFVIDGVAFVGTCYPINFGHATSNTGSLLQFNAVRNCVFTNSSKMILPDDYGATNLKVLDVTIEDCAIDVHATDRRAITNPLINIRSTFGSLKNIAVITQHCLADNAFATIPRTDASLMKWTSKLDGFVVDTDSITFYAGEHASPVEVEGTKVPATCMKEGSVTVDCATCGKTDTVVLPKDGNAHTGNNTVVGKEDATCGEGGYTGDTKCECGAIIEEGEATEPTENHDFTIEQSKTAATCVAEGSVTMKCSACDATETKTLAIDSTAHTGKNTIVGAVAGDCGNAGHTGKTVCECGVTIDAGEVIPATGEHGELEYVVKIPASVENEGIAFNKCTVCGLQVGEDIVLPKTGAVTVNGQPYADLQAALDAAVSGDVIKLAAAAKIDHLVVDPGVTIDLNGYTLEAEYVVGFNGSAIGGEGKLIVSKDQVALDQSNGGWLPVYDGNGYVFTKVTLTGRTAFIGSNTYAFSPVFNELVHEALMQGKENSGVRIVIRLTWEKAENYRAKQDYTYLNELVQSVIGSYDEEKGNYAKAFSAVLAGDEAGVVENIQVSAVVLSDTGVEIASVATPFVG